MKIQRMRTYRNFGVVINACQTCQPVRKLSPFFCSASTTRTNRLVNSKSGYISTLWHRTQLGDFCKHLEWCRSKSIYIWLVVSPPLKDISQLGWWFPIYGKYKMFQTTNQIYIYIHIYIYSFIKESTHISAAHLLQINLQGTCPLLQPNDRLAHRRPTIPTRRSHHSPATRLVLKEVSEALEDIALEVPGCHGWRWRFQTWENTNGGCLV